MIVRNQINIYVEHNISLEGFYPRDFTRDLKILKYESFNLELYLFTIFYSSIDNTIRDYSNAHMNEPLNTKMKLP